jgi:hypothetical protein
MVNEITDAGLKALAVNGHKFLQLQGIHLSSNEITDAGLEALAVNGHKFPQLQIISLGHNQISYELDRYLKDIFPDKELGDSKIRVSYL